MTKRLEGSTRAVRGSLLFLSPEQKRARAAMQRRVLRAINPEAKERDRAATRKSFAKHRAIYQRKRLRYGRQLMRSKSSEARSRRLMMPSHSFLGRFAALKS